MKNRITTSILLVSFAFAAGLFAFRVWSPLQTPEYFVGGEVRPYVASAKLQGGGESLYLRKTLHLSLPVKHAWIRLVGYDGMAVFVNGHSINPRHQAHPYGANVLVLDITPNIERGVNCIGIYARQEALKRPPAVAIEGAVVTIDDRERSLTDGWKCNDFFQRRDTFWYDSEFDDGDWPAAVLAGPQFMRGQTPLPPRAITKRLTARWIAPRDTIGGSAAIRREFQIEGRPQHGWMRVITTTPFSAAINGHVVFRDDEQFGSPPPYRIKYRVFDLSPYLKSGANVVSFMMNSHGETPRLWAELEAENKRGDRTLIESDASWMAREGTPSDWLTLSSADATRTENWRHVVEEPIGAMESNLWRRLREYVESPLSWERRVKDAAWAWGFMLAAGLGAWLACGYLGRLIAVLSPNTSPEIAYAPLLLPTVAALAGTLATYDTAVGQADVYQLRWLVIGAAVLIAQWVLLVVLAAVFPQPVRIVRGARALRAALTARRLAVAAALFAIVCLGAWLRLRDLLTEPMHHDEVGAYFFTTSVWKYGFPGGQVARDMTFGFAATSELVYFFNAPFVYFFDEPRLVVRVPAVCWSMASILLLFYVGRRMFNSSVGLLAAALLAASPYMVGLANFGRYFCQMQFFALLTVYFFWHTIRDQTQPSEDQANRSHDKGPINRLALWLSAICFAAMYLSWEGSGFLALGMMAAALFVRRGNLRSIFQCPSVYAGMTMVGAVFLAQNSHRIFQQTQRLWYGIGVSNVSIAPMWRYPRFDPFFYLFQSSWIADSLLPMIGLGVAALLAVRSPYRQPLRVLLIIFCVTAIGMSSLLPLRATRYVVHLAPLMILFGAVALVAMARGVIKLSRTPRSPASVRTFASFSAVVAVLLIAALSSGHVLNTLELNAYRTWANRPSLAKFPNWEEPLRYVRKNFQRDDVVIVLYPHIVDLTMKMAKDYPVGEDWRSDYWLQSVMVLQATLSDTEPVSLDRRAGTVKLGDKASIERVFDDHERVWYLTIRPTHNRTNRDDVSQYMRQHMDVVFEDQFTMVMLRDKNHRTAHVRFEQDEISEEARAWIFK